MSKYRIILNFAVGMSAFLESLIVKWPWLTRWNDKQSNKAARVHKNEIIKTSAMAFERKVPSDRIAVDEEIGNGKK